MLFGNDNTKKDDAADANQAQDASAPAQTNDAPDIITQGTSTTGVVFDTASVQPAGLPRPEQTYVDPLPTFSEVSPMPAPVSAIVPTTPAVPAVPEYDLEGLKRQALSSLAPIVDKLDQTPDEKFGTIMMLLQNTDDKLLLQKAYDAASSISDEKARAEALFDIVNEINYLTHDK